ncbi:hypothetical protein [Sulfitobacter sp.]|uniref:hypothetical protein n=1 Tax=Sulfitobacter sp. TaxID=1903071 RepID=UPI003FCE7CB9
MVHIFNSDQRHLKTIGQPGNDLGAFSTPQSITFDTQGRLCVTDRANNRLKLFDAKGHWLGRIEGLHKTMYLALPPRWHAACQQSDAATICICAERGIGWPLSHLFHLRPQFGCATRWNDRHRRHDPNRVTLLWPVTWH